MAELIDTLTGLLADIPARSGRLNRYRQAYDGRSPAAYMSRDSRKAIDQRLNSLGVNYPRMYVKALTDRLGISGYRRQGDQDLDTRTWELWRAAGLSASSQLVHTDRLIYGNAYVTVWAHKLNPRQPVVMIDSPMTANVATDPATGEVLAGVRMWETADGTRHALLMEPNDITRWQGKRDVPPEHAGTWNLTEHIPNPWARVPMVPFTRQETADDTDGTSLLSDVLDLADGYAKVLQDAVVTSEYYARPRRWATGLEIEYDENDEPRDPFGDSRFLQSEDPETKFGQLNAASLDGYKTLLDQFTAAIGSVTGLPPHYLGIYGNQPANAESIRASESQLVAQAYTEQHSLDRPWSQVAGWLNAIADGLTDIPAGLLPRWENPETRTPAAEADAAAKLAAIGVPLRTLLDQPLRYEPHQITAIMDTRRADQIETASLNALTGGTNGTR